MVTFRLGFSKLTTSGIGAVTRTIARTAIPRIIPSLFVGDSPQYPSAIFEAINYKDGSIIPLDK